MQIILLEKVANVGNLGDIVDVKNGYARNYLIPQRKAKRATKAALADFEARRAEIEKQQAERLAAAEAVGAKLAGYTFQIAQKSGVDGRLFGSVTNHDVAEVARQAGFETVEKAIVRLPNGPIKAVGEYEVKVALHPDVVVDVVVVIVPEAA